MIAVVMATVIIQVTARYCCFKMEVCHVGDFYVFRFSFCAVFLFFLGMIIRNVLLQSLRYSRSASTIGLVLTVPKERALSGEPLSIHHGEILMVRS